MKTTIELETQPIYEAHIRKEIKKLRRQRGKEAAQQMVLFTLFLAGCFGIFVGFNNGYFDNVDVIGACHWVNDNVMALAETVSNSIKGYGASTSAPV